MRISDWSSDVCSSDLRPADVRLLVEARLELDQRGHRLAPLGRLDQRLDDRRIVGGSIRRLLDGNDGGVLRRLPQELHDEIGRATCRERVCTNVYIAVFAVS